MRLFILLLFMTLGGALLLQPAAASLKDQEIAPAPPEQQSPRVSPDDAPPKDDTAPSLKTPLQGMRRMLQALDALILAFQEESQTFIRLVEIYNFGGPHWQRVKKCIDENWAEIHEADSI